jgi:hypothetical protein
MLHLHALNYHDECIRLLLPGFFECNDDNDLEAYALVIPLGAELHSTRQPKIMSRWPSINMVMWVKVEDVVVRVTHVEIGGLTPIDYCIILSLVFSQRWQT